MKPIKTKRELRNELQQQINDFLHQGGEVKAIPRGVSGREGLPGPLTPLFQAQPGTDRTPLPDVVAAIEARRKPAPEPRKAARKLRPRKKIILDDFGQPLRWEWVEE